MSKANQLLLPSVNKLLRAVNVKVFTYTEVLEKFELKPYHYEAIQNFKGFYDPELNIIGFDDNCQENANEIVLHELIHLTGSEGRVGRQYVKTVNQNLRSEFFEEVSNKNKQTEEATAQIGMFKLILVLGVNPAFYADACFEYIKNLPKANFKKADRDSDKAVHYLMRFMGEEKVA